MPASWRADIVTVAAAAVMLVTRLNPMWMLVIGGALGGLGIL
jgi:chromate transporter